MRGMTILCCGDDNVVIYRSAAVYLFVLTVTANSQFVGNQWIVVRKS
jgi:hypothetical protein